MHINSGTSIVAASAPAADVQIDMLGRFELKLQIRRLIGHFRCFSVSNFIVTTLPALGSSGEMRI